MKNIFNLIFIVILIFSGCKKEEDPQYGNKVIVESYILPGNVVQVKLDKLIAFNNDTISDTIDLDELNIYISDDSKSTLLKNYGSGIYADSNFQIIESVNYRLSFNYQERKIFAETSIPVKPANCKQSVTSISVPSFSGGSMPSSMPSFPDPVKITWTSTPGLYYLVIVENIEENPTSINDFTGDRPSRIFRNEPLQTNTFELESMQFNYLGKHQIVIFSLNPEYAVLYQDGGSSSQNLTGINTNVENGLGIFTGVNSDTLFLTVKKQ